MSTRPPVNKWVVTASIGFGSLMATIDSSIVNVALPHIRGSVGATLSEIAAISTGYIVASVLIMPLTGFLGALFGQKRVYMVSLALFIIGSALCGTARSLTVLVLFRVLQGLGAGSLQPTQQAILRQTFPPEEQGMAMAMYAMVIMVGPALGPPLGGWITDTYSWPWIFYVNLPVGLMGLFMVWRFVHEPDDVREQNKKRAAQMRANVDWSGIILMAIAIGTMQYLFEEGPSNDWLDSSRIVVALFICVSASVAFVVNELTTAAPAVNLRLFADRTFAAGTLIGAVMFAMLMGSMFLLPVFLQELLHYDATTSGLAMMPRTIVMALTMPLVGRLYNKLPPALMVGFGVITFALGSWQMSRITLETSTWDIVTPLAITGVGFAFLFVPLTTAALSSIPRHQLADASGLNSFVRQIGGSIGLAIFTSLLSRFGAQAKAGIVAQLTFTRPVAVERFTQIVHVASARGFDLITSVGFAQQALGGMATLQATVLAFEKSFLLQGISFLAVLPLLFFLRVERGPKKTVHIEAME